MNRSHGHLAAQYANKTEILRAADEALFTNRDPSAWPPSLTEAFEQSLALRHYELGRFLLWIGFGVTIASMAIDFAAFPEHAPLMIALRVGLVIPLQMAALLMRPDQLALQKLLMGLSIIAFAGVLLYGVQWAPPLTGAYLSIGPVILLGVAAQVLPYSSREVMFMLLTFTLTTLTLAMLVDAPAMRDPAFGGILLITVIVSLILPRRMWRMEARNFLVALQSEARLQELELANSVLDDLSRKDPLTGLANRRHATEIFARHFVAAPATDDAGVAVMMVDLDHFKAFNDRWGHQLGDQCLCAVAEELRHCAARNGGLAARFGGEEFVLILRAANASQALALAERVRVAIERIEIPHEESGDTATVSTSIGLAVHMGGAVPDLPHLLGAADTALYTAKTRGRNRCELAD